MPIMEVLNNLYKISIIIIAFGIVAIGTFIVFSVMNVPNKSTTPTQTVINGTPDNHVWDIKDNRLFNKETGEVYLLTANLDYLNVNQPYLQKIIYR